MKDPALSKAIIAAGGVNSLAKKLGISSQAVSQWETAPAERVIAIERATNSQVTRSQLRPDLYPESELAAATALDAASAPEPGDGGL
jgi:DNA-binding transcriptional regulator YdaS (Cro superfamily)